MFCRICFKMRYNNQIHCGRRVIRKHWSAQVRALRFAALSVGVTLILSALGCGKPEQVPASEVNEAIPIQSEAAMPSEVPTNGPEVDAKPAEQSKEATNQNWNLPLYPGATKIEEIVRGVVKTYTLRTKDSPNKVIEFYRDKIGEILGEITVGPTATIKGQRLNEHFTIVAMELGDETQIDIRIEQSP